MKVVQVLGTGCPKCTKLAESVASVAREAGIEIDLKKVTDINEIIAFGVMSTPALAIDGQVVLTGRVPGAEEIKTLLSKG